MELAKITGLRGEVNIPGDKSISHRCIMFGSIASGTTEISNFLQGADCLATINCFRRMGIEIENQEEKDKFLTWLDDLEYNVYGLPRPNVTIFLDMPPKYGIELMKDRANKSNGGDKKDIHESDISYLQKSYDNAVYVSKRFGWKHISCVENGKIRSVEDINDDIYAVIKERLS